MSPRLPFAAALLVVACAASPRPAAPPADRPLPLGELAAIRERGRLVMVAFPHQESHFVRADLSKGKMPAFGPADHFAGIDVEVMGLFAESLGVELWVRRASEPSYAALIPDLLGAHGDVIASSLSITDERKKRVVFSRPYHEVYPVVIVRKGSAIRAVRDLAGKVGAAIPGSSQEERLHTLGVPVDLLHPVSFMYENYVAVAEGEADYTLVDSGSAARVLAKVEGVEIGFRLPGSDFYGYALRPGSDLLPALDGFLEELEASGRLAEIVARHSASE